MRSLAVEIDALEEAELSTLAEAAEQAAWRDAMQAMPAALLSECGIHAMQIGDALLLASYGSQSLMFNRVIGLGEHVPAADETIAEIMDRYWQLGVRQYLVHVGADGRPMSLGRKLEQQGLSLYRRSWVKLIRPATPAPRSGSETMVRDATLSDAAAVASIIGSAFDLTQAEAEIFAHLIDRPRWRVFVAEVKSELAAVGILFVNDRTAYLAAAATRPQWRCKGAQRALLHARIEAARTAGCDYIAVETGFPLTADEPSPSYHNLLWAGFRPLSIRDNYAPCGTQWNHGVT